jgi:nucleotide-binding universal stress UspA family protein
MYQRILVPIDGSPTSEHALQEAIKLADGKSRLRLIYVIEATYPLDAVAYTLIDHAALQEAIRKTGERALAKAAEKVQRSGMTAETELLDVPAERVSAVIDSDAGPRRMSTAATSSTTPPNGYSSSTAATASRGRATTRLAGAEGSAPRAEEQAGH